MGGGEKVQQWVGGNSAEWGGRATVGVRAIAGGRGSTKALRALNARWALPAYPVFEDEKSNGSDDNPVKRKIA